MPQLYSGTLSMFNLCWDNKAAFVWLGLVTERRKLLVVNRGLHLEAQVKQFLEFSSIMKI